MKKVIVEYLFNNERKSIILKDGEVCFRTYSELTPIEVQYFKDYDGRFLFNKDHYLEIRHDLLHLSFLKEATLSSWDYLDLEALSIKTAYQDNNYYKILNECFTFLEAEAKFFKNESFIDSYSLVVYNRKITNAKIDCLISWVSKNGQQKKLFNNMNLYFMLKKDADVSKTVQLHEIGLETFLENNGILAESDVYDIDVECFVNQKSIGSISVMYF